MPTSEFDAILLGSGHNSLITQAYLTQAGLRTLCLEARHCFGGGLTTVEWPENTGFLHNTHSFFHRGITHMPWYRDLDLAKYGARYLSPDLNATLIVNDRECLQWWRDFDQTEASFAQLCRRDARTLRQWRDRFRPELVGWIQREAECPPEQPDQREARLQKSANGRLLLELSQKSPRDFVAQEFEHPAVQSALLFFNGLREVDPRATGFGHHIPALISGDRMAEMCVGGSHQLAAALVTRIQASGGTLRADVDVERIVVDEQNRVVGVQVDGELIGAPTVISGLNPQQTFLELIDDRRLPHAWQQQAQQFRYNVLAPLFTINVNLEARPEYAIEEHHPEVADSLMVILGIRDLNRFDEIVQSHDRGEIPPTTMWGSCPSRFDPAQAPAGRHTAFMWEKVPFRLSSDSWDDQIEDHVGRMWDTWRRFAPNLDDARIELLPASPRQIPNTFPNMRDGDLLVGALNHGQIGYHRPFPGAGHYRTCFHGLYLCGSCCHPGGNITGLPGYNAAQVIHSDLDLPPIKENA